MKFIKQYIEEKYSLQTKGRVTLKHIYDDAGLDGVKVYINNVETGLFISQAEYDEWVESMFDEMIKSKNNEKLTNKITPRFKVGNWVVYNNTNVYQVKKIEYIINMIPRYELENIDGDKFSIPFTSDYNLRRWTIQDARDGDVLVTTNKNIFIFKDIKGAAIYDYCGLFFGEFKSVSNCVNGTISIRLPNDYLPATKPQRDILFAKIKEYGYEWDSDNKKLNEIEPKNLEQSEDERIRKDQDFKRWIDWLEKLGKQDNSEIKDYYGIDPHFGRTIEIKSNWIGEVEDRIKNILSVLDVQVCWNGATGKKENPYQKEIDCLKFIKDRIGCWSDSHRKNVPSRELILSIWDLGNIWEALTNGEISTEHGTQLDYIQKHWHENNKN